MSKDKRVLIDSGKDALCESYINPFKDCENCQQLNHILDLFIQGKLYPYVIHCLPFTNDVNHPGTLSFDRFSKRLQEERAKPDGTSDWLKVYRQLSDASRSPEEIYTAFRSEACEKGMALPQQALEKGNAVYADFSGIPDKGKNLLYKDARQCYINLRKLDPELPPLPAKKSDIIAGLQELQDCCIQVGKQRNKADEGPVLKLTRAARQAYESYEYALRREPSLSDKSDDEAYEWFENHGTGEADYSLPSIETWKRYVRAGRKHHGTQKNSPRAGRNGRSIVQSSQIEHTSSQEPD